MLRRFLTQSFALPDFSLQRGGHSVLLLPNRDGAVLGAGGEHVSELWVGEGESPDRVIVRPRNHTCEKEVSMR